MVIALIAAGGSSRRMGFDKLWSELAGQPVLAWTMQKFQESAAVDGIIVVTRGENRQRVKDVAGSHGIEKLLRVIPGGSERHLSVWQGLLALPAQTEYVAVHDAARPLLSPQLIEKCLAAAKEHGAACCAVPVTDTLKRADKDGFITGSVDREDVWAMQTPQVFRADLLLPAYKLLIESGQPATDETSVVERTGARVALVSHHENNMKITYPSDLELAQRLLSGNIR